MSAVEGLPTPPPSSVEAAVPDPRADALPTLCPYLATVDGTWRSAIASREHQCTAVAPPVHLALEKQRRLCLVAAHVGCATYEAAVAARAGPSRRPAGQARPIARTTPIVLDQRGLDLHIPALRGDRASGQVFLVGLLGIAFLAILIARPAGNPGPAGGADASGSSRPNAGTSIEGAAAPTTDAPTGTIAPTSTAAGAESAAPSNEPGVAQPTATAATAPSSPPPASAQPAMSGATYRVLSGDTLSAIAARFGTTTKVLVDLNGISDPSKLKIGQILRLP